MASSSIYVNKDLYLKTTDELISEVFNGLSLTSTFAINIKDSSSLSNQISFLAYEATLPGTSFQTADIFGDRQGITETYATRRIFSHVDISFYIKADYSTILYFENWMQKIGGNVIGGLTNPTSFYKMQYPDEYKKTDINVIKYERDFRTESQRLLKGGGLRDPKSITYSLLRAYPTNIISIPVSYDESSILKTTITFNYDRYVFQTHDGKNPGQINGTNSSSNLNRVRTISTVPKEPGFTSSETISGGSTFEGGIPSITIG